MDWTRPTYDHHTAVSAPVPVPAPALALVPENDSEMTALFQAMEMELASRRMNVEQLQQTANVLTTKGKLFDKDDVDVTLKILEARKKELDALEVNFAECRAMYEENIKAVETLIQEKDREIKELDATFGAISGEPTLTEHFAGKHAEQLRTLHQAKSELCANLKQRFRDTNPTNSGWGGEGKASLLPVHTPSASRHRR